MRWFMVVRKMDHLKEDVGKRSREEPVRWWWFGVGWDCLRSSALASCGLVLVAMGQNPNRTPSEHPNPH